MLRRLGWIVATYFTRKLILAIIAFGVLFLAATSLDSEFNRRYGTAYPPPPGPRLMVDSRAALERVRREGKQAEVDAINLNSLWTDMHWPQKPSKNPQMKVIEDYRPPGAAFYEVLAEFPNLRFVHADFAGSYVGTEQVAGVSKLEYLFVDGRPPADFAWMRSLEKLRWLQLGVYSPPKGLDALKAVPNLETIVFRHPFEVNDDVLEALAGLPHLKLLVLDLGYSRLGNDYLFSEAGLSALARSRSLETLYAGGESPADRVQLLRMARRALPRLDVKPALSAAMPIVLVWMVPFCLFAVAIGLALSAQFRLPQSRLAPGFGVSHALVAGLFLVVIVAGGAASLAAAGNDPFASIVVASALAATAVCMGSADTAPRPSDVRRQQLGNLLKTVMFFCAMGPLFMTDLGDEILHGYRPWILMLLGLVALVAVGLTVNDLQRLVTSAMGTSSLDRERGWRRMLVQSQFAAGWMFALSRREHLIDAWKSGPPRWTWWRRVRRWQIGNAPFRSVPFMLMMLGFFVTFWFLFRSMLLRGQSRPTWSPANYGGLRGQFFVAGMMLAGMTTYRLALTWRARMLTLSVEFLRPYARRGLQNEMAAAFVFDHVPPALVVAAVGAVGINLGSELRVDWARVPLDFGVVGLACLAMTVGLGALIVVVKRDWLLAVLVLTVGLLTAVAVAVVTAALVTPSQRLHELTPRVVESQLWLLVVVGFVLAGVMRQRFMAMEIGSRA